MKSLYNENETTHFSNDLEYRVYTSRLLGKEPSLVLHGGGNTSVKSKVTNLFGEEEDILHVKGSGWDLATIEAEGFAPVKMDTLLKMAELNELSDADMVSNQRAAMINPSAPNPSVEAILHAIIPFKYVDHTHADAIVTITNTKNGEAKIKEIFGSRILVIPYIMPGFVLAKLVYDMTRSLDWHSIDGLVLMNHGLFSFADDAKSSYEMSIKLVSEAEAYLAKSGALLTCKTYDKKITLLEVAKMRQAVSKLKASNTVCKVNQNDIAMMFVEQNIDTISQQGPLTPDHVIRTKRIPAILEKDFEHELETYKKAYISYFESNKKDETMLSPTPNFALYKNHYALSFGKSLKEAKVIEDITTHTFNAIMQAEKLGGYKALKASEIFEVEYWSLEQAKLKKSASAKKLQGTVILIHGNVNEKNLMTQLQSEGAEVISISDTSEIATIILNYGGIDSVILLEDNRTLMNTLCPYLELSLTPKVVTLNSDEAYSFQINIEDEKMDALTIDTICNTIIQDCAVESVTLQR